LRTAAGWPFLFTEQSYFSESREMKPWPIFSGIADSPLADLFDIFSGFDKNKSPVSQFRLKKISVHRYRCSGVRLSTSRHGEPTATTRSRISLTTVDPAPITVWSPILRLWMMVAPAQTAVNAPTSTSPHIVAPGKTLEKSPSLLSSTNTKFATFLDSFDNRVGMGSGSKYKYIFHKHSLHLRHVSINFSLAFGK
jgi:hypothetical protein